MGLRKGCRKRSGQKSLGQSKVCQLARLLLKEMACSRDHCKGSVRDVWL